MIGAAGELDCFSAHIRLRELGKSEDKADRLRTVATKGDPSAVGFGSRCSKTSRNAVPFSWVREQLWLSCSTI
ncbi:hypothetical protein B296_00020482 [Ensete ventricosum]|uniref:Uncharacterized protein n=1 Tax=Ensete ventricosum TaxID=4639 RepID=A0A426ZBT7_ENSVE|nr:hypothetical protein B296_00020482 [Ensete ventricosum]